MRTLIVVLGMHRSATSALAGALTRLGATAPVSLLGPSRNNPKGYFESPDILKLNDQLLEDHGRTWRTVRPVFEDLNAPIGDPSRLRTIVERLAAAFPEEADLAMLKDPRLGVLWPIWRQALEANGPDLRMLIPVRDADAVARSLVKREGWTFGRGVALWLRNVLDGERFTRGQRRHFVDSRKFVEDPVASLASAVARLDLDLPRDAEAMAVRLDGFVEPGLLHEPGKVEGAFAEDVAEATVALRALMNDPDDVAAQGRLDAVRARFDSRSGLLEDLFIEADVQRDAERAEAEASLAEVRQKLDHARRELEAAAQDRSELRQRLVAAEGARIMLEKTAVEVGKQAVQLGKRPHSALVRLIRFRSSRWAAKQSWLGSAEWRDRRGKRAQKYDPKAPLSLVDRARHQIKLDRLIRENELDRALEIVRKSPRSRLPKTAAMAVEAILLERKFGFAAAAKQFSDLADTLERQERPELPRFLIKKGQASRYGPVAKPVPTTPLSDKPVVYTSLFGNYDRLPPVFIDTAGIDFVCFTDQDLHAPGWRIEKRAPCHDDPNLAAKYYKVMAHEVFPDHQASLFVDANTLFMGRLDGFVQRWLAHNDFAMWRHPEREDVVDEAEAVILLEKDRPDIVCAQMSAYERANLPRHAGMYECSFLWRRHHAPEVKALMEAWWQEINQYSKRDQISFYYLVHTLGPKPLALPPELGTSRENILFAKLPHSPVRPMALGKPHTKPKVAFLYDEKTKDAGSTVMRGAQLSTFLGKHLGDRAEFTYTSDVDLPRDSLVVVTKRMIDRMSQSDLQALRQRNIAIAADPIDVRIEPKKLGAFDLVLAASLSAQKYFGKTAVETPVYLLTHHADPRIADFTPPADRLRIGYFGEFANTIGTEELDELVDYHSVTTREQQLTWLDKLADYNAHFAVRKVRTIDGFKPFTKGFIAAKCGAVIICERDQGDNAYYLGDDYPYYVPSSNLQEIELFLREMQESFGSSTWTYAQEIMTALRRRSSEDWISREFATVLDAVFA